VLLWVLIFETGNYLIVDQLSYNFEDPQRGEIIIFRYPNDPKKFFIKRVIGLPNETIKISSSKVFIKNTENPNGFELDEPYLQNTGSRDTETTLKEEEYYVAELSKTVLNNNGDFVILYDSDGGEIDKIEMLKETSWGSKTWQLCDNWEFKEATKIMIADTTNQLAILKK